jgi:hypothetical protein
VGSHEVERIGEPVDTVTVTARCGDQDRTARAGVVIVYTGVRSRRERKYDFPRAYRTALLGAGRLSQTVDPLVTGLGSRMTFVAAIRDELEEQLLGLSAAEEFVLGRAVIGTLPTAAV